MEQVLQPKRPPTCSPYTGVPRSTLVICRHYAVTNIFNSRYAPQHAASCHAPPYPLPAATLHPHAAGVAVEQVLQPDSRAPRIAAAEDLSPARLLQLYGTTYGMSPEGLAAAEAALEEALQAAAAGGAAAAQCVEVEFGEVRMQGFGPFKEPAVSGSGVQRPLGVADQNCSVPTISSLYKAYCTATPPCPWHVPSCCERCPRCEASTLLGSISGYYAYPGSLRVPRNALPYLAPPGGAPLRGISGLSLLDGSIA